MVVLRTTTYRLAQSMVFLYLPFQAVSAVSFSLTMCLLSGLLCSCFLPSSVFLIHDVCTSFHASVQVNRNLVLWLVSRETITVDGSLGWVQGIRVWAYSYQGIRMSNIVYQNMRISGHYDIKQVPDIMITVSGYQGIYQGINNVIIIYGYQRIYQGIRMVFGISWSGYEAIRHQA